MANKPFIPPKEALSYYLRELKQAVAARDVRMIKVWATRFIDLDEMTNEVIEYELQRLRDPHKSHWRKLAVRKFLDLYPHVNPERVVNVAKRMKSHT